jgi:replication factor A1
MQIADLQPKQGNVNITAKVIEVGQPREFSKFGNSGKVATALIQDPSGQMSFSLWNEQIDQVAVGDEVTITNGFVSEWRGQLQLTTGRMGAMTVKKK